MAIPESAAVRPCWAPLRQTTRVMPLSGCAVSRISRKYGVRFMSNFSPCRGPSPKVMCSETNWLTDIAAGGAKACASAVPTTLFASLLRLIVTNICVFQFDFKTHCASGLSVGADRNHVGHGRSHLGTNVANNLLEQRPHTRHRIRAVVGHAGNDLVGARWQAIQYPDDPGSGHR